MVSGLKHEMGFIYDNFFNLSQNQALMVAKTKFNVVKYSSERVSSMQHIRHTIQLYRQDWKRIFKNPIATLLMIALMIIPSLYAWFNIKALWDPYGNTSELPIAVYSDDQSATFEGQTVSIGEEVLKNLKENKQLGWQFVDSKKDLEEGVKSGEYYAGIYLPKDFSEDLLSFTTGDITKPKIEYYVNEKINAIAPKITSKGATSLQEQISSEFIGTASSTLMSVFNTIGYDIDENLVSINKLKSLILSTNDNLSTIDGYTKEVVDLQQKLPDIKEKLNQANQLVDYLPEVDAMADKLVALNDKLPELKQEASIILTLQAKIPEIQAAGEQLAMIDEDFDSVANTLNEGVDEAKQGLQVIQQVQQQLPEIEQLGDQAGDFAQTTKEAAEQLNGAVDGISASVKTTIQSVQLVSDDVAVLTTKINEFLADNELTDEEREALGTLLSSFDSSLQSQITAVDNVIVLLTQLQNQAGDQRLQPLIDNLSAAKSLLTGLEQRIASIDVNQLTTADLQSLLTDITSTAAQISTALDAVNPDEIAATVKDILTKLIDTISTSQDLLTKAQAINFQQLLSSTEKTVSNGITYLEKYQQQLPAIKQEVHDANTMLNGHMDDIVAAINKGADLYNNDLPQVEAKLTKAADFIQQDWPALEEEIQTTLTTVNEKMPQVESALNTAVDLINNDWPSVRSGIEKAATAIRKGEEEVDLGELIKLLKLDASKESEFFQEPVEVVENALYPIANNGSASTPFYTALCLWVGAVLFSSVATTEVYLEEKDRKKYSKREQFSARMLTFLTMGIAQTLIVALGNIFLLGVDVRQPVYSVLFALLIGLVFTMMVYVLVALFGTIGKGLAIIILVLSISGGGGNYPIQVSGKFFQMVNPLLPFTYAVNLLRESAGGIYWPNAMKDCWVLIGIGVAFMVIGIWGYPYIEAHLKRLSKISHESKIFH